MAKPSRATNAAAPSQETNADMLPLDYMLQVLRDPEASPAERKWAAEKAAPYIHPRRQTVEHSGLALRHEDALEDLA